jgi:branched-chain amino acid transport system ATP-binding protein
MLNVSDLSISFGGVAALKSVSLTVRPGEIVGLIGPNGAGKTSLMNCISRYYQPTSGRIQFGDFNLLEMAPHQLLKLGISRSFQDLSLPPGLSVLENVMLGQQGQINTNVLRAIFDFNYLKKEEAKYRRQARDVLRLFADVRVRAENSQEGLGYPDIHGKGGYPDLLDVQDLPADILPYGIKRKVDLARAFVAQPRLLLLDEPASGLGSAELEEVIELIHGARSKYNTAILLVEHQMSLVGRLCDRIIVLDYGEKIAEGTLDEIKKNERVVQAYLGKRATTISSPPSPETGSVPPAVIMEIKGVDVRYGHVKALSGVSLNFREEGITAILGSNGAGKSTLMKAISGIEALSNGEIYYRGERLAHYLQKPRPDQIVRKGVVLVPEGRRIFKELSVLENLRVASYAMSDKRRVAGKCEKVFHYFPQLKANLRLRDAGNLSGGQQQMLAIGQALIMEPRLLLLDEPSLGLSPNLVEELYSIIMQINQQEHCAIVIAEQNAHMALRFSHEAYVIDSGFIVKSGKSADLLADEEIIKLYLG